MSNITNDSGKLLYFVFIRNTFVVFSFLIHFLYVHTNRIRDASAVASMVAHETNKQTRTERHTQKKSVCDRHKLLNALDFDLRSNAYTQNTPKVYLLRERGGCHSRRRMCHSVCARNILYGISINCFPTQKRFGVAIIYFFFFNLIRSNDKTASRFVTFSVHRLMKWCRNFTPSGLAPLGMHVCSKNLRPWNSFRAIAVMDGHKH